MSLQTVRLELKEQVLQHETVHHLCCDEWVSFPIACDRSFQGNFQLDLMIESRYRTNIRMRWSDCRSKPHPSEMKIPHLIEIHDQ